MAPTRKYWTSEEDAKLIQYVTTHGEGDWKKVAESLGIDKDAGACYRRYTKQLSKGLVHGDFTEVEIGIIQTLWPTHPMMWSFIARHLPGRTDQNVKNWYHKQMNKERRELRQALATAAAGPSAGVSSGANYLHDGEAGNAFNQQFVNNSGGGGGVGFDDYNQHYFVNNGGGADVGAAVDLDDVDNLDEILNNWFNSGPPGSV